MDQRLSTRAFVGACVCACERHTRAKFNLHFRGIQPDSGAGKLPPPLKNARRRRYHPPTGIERLTSLCRPLKYLLHEGKNHHSCISYQMFTVFGVSLPTTVNVDQLSRRPAAPLPTKYNNKQTKNSRNRIDHAQADPAARRWVEPRVRSPSQIPRRPNEPREIAADQGVEHLADRRRSAGRFQQKPTDPPRRRI